MIAPLDIHLEIVAGDDYKAADGRALAWSSTAWPNLAGASLSMVIGHTQYNLYGNLPVTVAGAVPASPASPTVVSLDLAGSATSQLPAGEYQYMLTSKLSDGDTVTIAQGNLSILTAPNTLPLYPPAV